MFTKFLEFYKQDGCATLDNIFVKLLSLTIKAGVILFLILL